MQTFEALKGTQALNHLSSDIVLVIIWPRAVSSFHFDIFCTVVDAKLLLLLLLLPDVVMMMLIANAIYALHFHFSPPMYTHHFNLINHRNVHTTSSLSLIYRNIDTYTCKQCKHFARSLICIWLDGVLLLLSFALPCCR